MNDPIHQQHFLELRHYLLANAATDLLARLDGFAALLDRELAAGAATGSPGGTLLLVDDEPSILFLMEEFLDDEGYVLHRATNGSEARDLLRDEGLSFDAVVVDRIMPKMSGIALLRWMRTEPRLAALPAILQTGSLSAQEAAEGLAAGAAFHLLKPYDMDRFRALVRVAVRSARPDAPPSSP